MAHLPPEVLFHRYFQNSGRHPLDRQTYRGKQNLDTLAKEIAVFLRDVQNALNEALYNEKQNVPEHVEHPPFHFDYIESNVANALAFRDDERNYSFIGITMPLVYLMWDSCVALSKSQAVAALLEVPATPEGEETILTIMFQTQLAFMVVHEYTHHVHGHFSQRAPGSPFFNEIEGEGKGNLDEQVFELDADGYAVFHVLAHLIAGPRREQAIKILSCGGRSVGMQDETLFSSFVIAIGAFLYSLPPASASPSEVYCRTHPIQAVRMRWIMDAAISWCKQNERASLAEFMTVNRFQALMSVVDRTMRQTTGHHDWRAQTAFLKSEDGSKYVNTLFTLVRESARTR